MNLQKFHQTREGEDLTPSLKKDPNQKYQCLKICANKKLENLTKCQHCLVTIDKLKAVRSLNLKPMSSIKAHLFH